MNTALEKATMSAVSVLGNYGSNRVQAVQEDLNSFKIFLLHLKYQYKERAEIPRAIIRLLHMYHPQDGFEAFMKLVRVMCVLLEEMDSNVIKYLLSIIPPPVSKGLQEDKSINEKVKEVTGFTLLSNPAFHTWVLPVIKNNTSITQKVNTDITKSEKILETFKSPDNSEEQSKPVQALGASQLTGSHVDNEHIPEPKLENYNLYEVGGNISKTMLNQHTSQPTSENTARKNLKNMYKIEALMVPSALKASEATISSCSKEEDQNIKSHNLDDKKSLAVSNLSVDPVLENSMKNFIAKACGLKPNIPLEDFKSKTELQRKCNKRRKKNINNSTNKNEMRIIPKQNTSLLDDFICPQKKNLLSSLITPLDPATETNTNITVNKLPKLTDDNNAQKTSLSSTVQCLSNENFDDESEIKKIAVKNYSMSNNTNSIYSTSTEVCNNECVLEKTCSDSKEIKTITEIPECQEMQTSVPNLISTNKEEINRTSADVTEVLTQTNQLTVPNISVPDRNMSLVSTSNNKFQFTTDKEKGNENVLNVSSCTEIKPECDEGPIHLDFPDKSQGFEWNVENLKLFDIKIPKEEFNSSAPESEKKLGGNNEGKYALSSPTVKENEASKSELFTPESYGFSFKSFTSAEHLSYLHELAVSKSNKQSTDPSLTSSQTNNKESLKLNLNNNDKPSCTEIPSSTQKPVTYHKNEAPSTSEEGQNQQLTSQGYAGDTSKNQVADPPTDANKLWSQAPGRTIDPFEIYRNLPLADPSRTNQYNCMGNVKLGPNLPGRSTTLTGASPCSVNSSYGYQTLPNSQAWMLKSSSNPQHVQQSLWRGYPSYSQHSLYRQLAQQRVALAQRAAYMQQASSSVNTYLDPSHAFMMNRLWGSYCSSHHELYTRPNEASSVIPGMPHSLCGLNDPLSQHQRLRAMAPNLFPNYTGPVIPIVASHSNLMQPPQAKRKKLEEIVGRLKENEKGT